MDTSDVRYPNGSLIEGLAGKLLRSRQAVDDNPTSSSIQLPRNQEWIQQSFMLTTDELGVAKLDKQDRLNRKISSATIKYTDSSPGGNIALNAPYQWTPYADIPDAGLHSRGDTLGLGSDSGLGEVPDYVQIPMIKGATYGMGRAYSEAIDDNGQIIHMRFGHASYNSLSQFFTGFYNSGMATLARSGRFEESMINSLGVATGNLIGLAIAPLFLVPLVLMAAVNTAKFLLQIPTTKFYYFKPSMPTYWTAVSSMVNLMSANLGVTNIFSKNYTARQAKDLLAKGNGLDASDIPLSNVVAQYVADDWMSERGLIDVRNIISRSKRLQQKFNLTLSELFENAGSTTAYEDVILQAYRNTREGGRKYDDGRLNPEDYLKRWADNWLGKKPDTEGASEPDIRQGVKVDYDAEGNIIGRTLESARSYASDVADFFIAEVADGSDWLSYRVDYTGQVGSSFNNSTSPSSLAGKLNSFSAQNRNLRINLAEGNILPGFETVMNAAKSVLSGVAEVLHIDGIAMLAGSAFVDIPDNWENSVANLPRSTYTMTLIGAYGNPISQLLDLYIPVATFLCGALPLATGAQSYTSPFLCQLHDRGRNFIRLGIIDSLSISAGTSNLGFNNEGRPMAIEISFTVKDLSSILAVPITSQGFSLLNPLEGLMDDQSTMHDYVMSMCGVSLQDMIYPFSMAKYRLTQKMNEVDTYFSASRVASQLTKLPGVGILNAIFQGTNR